MSKDNTNKDAMPARNDDHSGARDSACAQSRSRTDQRSAGNQFRPQGAQRAPREDDRVHQRSHPHDPFLVVGEHPATMAAGRWSPSSIAFEHDQNFLGAYNDGNTINGINHKYHRAQGFFNFAGHQVFNFNWRSPSPPALPHANEPVPGRENNGVLPATQSDSSYTQYAVDPRTLANIPANSQDPSSQIGMPDRSSAPNNSGSLSGNQYDMQTQTSSELDEIPLLFDLPPAFGSITGPTYSDSCNPSTSVYPISANPPSAMSSYDFLGGSAEIPATKTSSDLMQLQQRSWGAKKLLTFDKFSDAPRFVPQDHSTITLAYSTEHAAVQAVNDSMKRGKLHWTSPNPDNTIPQSDAQRQEVVRILLAAMKDSSQAVDNDKPAFKKRWAVDAKSKHDDMLMEATCWKIAGLAERLHKEGPTVLCVGSDCALETIKESASFTFEERIRYLVVLMSEFKARCERLVKGTFIDTVVGNPKDALRTSRENFSNNQERQKALKSSRENRPDKRERSEDSEPVHKATKKPKKTA